MSCPIDNSTAITPYHCYFFDTGKHCPWYGQKYIDPLSLDKMREIRRYKREIKDFKRMENK